MSRIFRTALTLAAAAVIVGACSSAGTSTPAATSAAPTTAPAAAAVNIDITGRSFPANTDVAKGTKVTWTNKSTEGHTVTSGTRPDKDGKFDMTLPAGTGTFSFTFPDAGTFKYYCRFHTGMDGTITVK